MGLVCQKCPPIIGSYPTIRMGRLTRRGGPNPRSRRGPPLRQPSLLRLRAILGLHPWLRLRHPQWCPSAPTAVLGQTSVVGRPHDARLTCPRKPHECLPRAAVSAVGAKYDNRYAATLQSRLLDLGICGRRRLVGVRFLWRCRRCTKIRV